MNKELVFRILETGIVELVDAFLARPYAFYTESDLHCFLYHTLCNLGLNQVHACMHGRYRRRRDTKSTSEKRGSRGHFDISVWDQVLTEQKQFRAPRGEGEQRTLAAVELSLNEHHKNFQWHVYWDLLKLKDPKNEVERGIILFFVRDYPYRRTRFPRNGFIRTLHEMFGDENKVPIVYVEKLGLEERKGTVSRASFLDYPYLEP